MAVFKIQVAITVEVPDNGELNMSPEQWAQDIADKYLNMAIGYSSVGADTAELIDIVKV